MTTVTINIIEDSSDAVNNIATRRRLYTKLQTVLTEFNIIASIDEPIGIPDSENQFGISEGETSPN